MKVSLVMPVKDEEGNIRRLLESISRQAILPDEVVFVNAGSTDCTKDIIEGYKDDRLQLKLVSIGAAHPGTARNTGINNARYDYIAFTDGGIELHDDWLKELKGIIEEDASVDVVYGHYAPRTDTLFKQCLSLAFVAPAKPVGGSKMRSDFIASSLLKKLVWQEVGGFPDFRAAEDRIFMEKVRGKGFKIRYNPKAIVTWDIPDDPRRTFRRFFNFSYHDLKAGKARGWHLPVLKMYLIALIFIFFGFFIAPIFFLLLITGFILRVAHKISANRGEPYFRIEYIPLYFIFTGFLILLIDVAMFAGWIKYLLKKD